MPSTQVHVCAEGDTDVSEQPLPRAASASLPDCVLIESEEERAAREKDEMR
jgi:hypothetical protein